MKTIQKLTLAVVAVAAMTACTQNDKTKFDAKEYAERKTERLDKIVDLSDAQEKEVYALYLAQGKEIKENIKTLKKECGEMKKPDCKKAEGCKKAECAKACDKAKCEKPCAKKAECTKACDKAKCEKPCAKKAECTKACDKAKCEKPCAKKAECAKACDKAKCEKPCAKKAECKKACDKAKCEKPCAKKAECNKPCDKKAECKQGHKHHKKHFRHHSLVSPERKKATFEQLGTILTPEQSAKLREHHARRHMCNQNKQCVPCNAQGK